MKMYKNLFSIFTKSGRVRLSTKAAEKTIERDNFIVDKDVNGMVVVSVNPRVKTISKVAAVFEAGSRTESYKHRGMNHLLRRSAGLSCGGITAINVTRHIQQMGANLRCMGTRESLAYIIDAAYDMIPKIGDLLPHITTRQEFYKWELSDFTKPLMITDIQYLKRRDFETLCSELVHKAAFGNNLGNSLFANEHQVGDWNLEYIEDFLDHTFTANKSLLVGVSVKHDQLITMAEKFKIRPLKEFPLSETKFRGGEIRHELPLEFAQACIVWETPGFNTLRECLSTSLLAYSIDNGINHRIKWNNGDLELIRKLTTNKHVRDNCVANSVNYSYSDKGLVGFNITGTPEVMKEAISVVHNNFVSVGKSGVSAPDFEIAKTLLVQDLLMKAQSSEGILENVINQVNSANDILSIEGLVAEVKKVTLEDVNKVAKSILSSSKKAMASVGDLSTVPFIDELN